MSNQWQYFPLTELVEHIVDNRGKTAPTADSGIPLIATNCISNTNLYPTYDKVRYVSEEVYRTWFRSHPQPKDIIFVNKGTPGLVCLVPDPVDFCIAQDMVALRPNQHIVFGEYLFAALRSPYVQEQIANLHVGTLIPHVKKGDFNKLLIPVPPMDIQIRIGQTYTDFCRKIDLNNRINVTLEATASAFFQSWSVGFDPVRAKAEGRLPEGIDSETAILFPDSFEESQLGLLPRGWTVGSILNYSNLLSGGTPKTDRPEHWDGSIPWASAKDVSQAGQTFLIHTERTITSKGLQESTTQLIPPLCTIIVARGATTGRMVLLGQAMAMNQTCYAIASTIDTPFSLYCHLRNGISALVHAGHGSVFNTITTSTFANSSVVIPPRLVLEAFEKVVSPIFFQILNKSKESSTLSTLRDELLPKLISGELGVNV